MKNLLKYFLILLPVFFIILFISTHGLLNAYFEQDEWGAFADTITSYNLPWWSFFASKGMHFIPLGSLFWKSLYIIFGFQANYYYLIELIIHSSISVLVFILTLRLTNNKAIALMTSILFLLNGRANQAFTHLAIFNSTDMAMFFIMLFFVYLSGINKKIISVKDSLILLLIFFLSICFREEGFMIIPIFIAYLLIFGKSKLNKENINSFIVLLLGVLGTFLIRFFAQTLNTVILPSNQQVTGDGALYNLLTLPIKFVVQNLIYSERIVLFLFKNVQKGYPDVNYFTSQGPLMDAAFFYVFIIITFVSVIWFWKVRPKNIISYLSFFLIWIGSNAFILAFVGRQLSVLEPRYLYFSSFPVFCFLSMFMYSLFVSKNKINILNIAKKTSVIVLFSVIIFASLQEIRISINNKIHQGIAKKEVLKNFHEIHPTLSKNTIFYLKCKEVCYKNGDYGIPNENVLPFSSGPGMIILATYSRGYEKEWGPFLANPFLWGLLDEGYKKIGNRSYGYFTTKSKLEDTLRENNLPSDIVVALEYDEESFKFKDISESFRAQLSNRR